jgi:hypothetical protein
LIAGADLWLKKGLAGGGQDVCELHRVGTGCGAQFVRSPGEETWLRRGAGVLLVFGSFVFTAILTPNFLSGAVRDGRGVQRGAFVAVEAGYPVDPDQGGCKYSVGSRKFFANIRVVLVGMRAQLCV